VPLCVRYGAGQEEARLCTVLETQTAALPLPEGARCPEWLYPNAEGAGYVRAQVVGAGAAKLTGAAVAHLSRTERVALLGDTLALAKAGVLPAGEALALVPRFAQEKDRQVLQAAMELLEVADPRLISEARMADRARFVRDLFAPRALAMGLVPAPWDDEDTRLLRSRLTRLVGRIGQESHLAGQARAMTERWLKDPRALPQESVEPVLAIAAGNGDAGLHTRLLEAVKRQEDRKVRQQLLWALGSFRDPALIRAHLPLLLDPAVDSREAMTLMWMATWDARTAAPAYAFVKEHYDTLLERLPEEFHPGLASVGRSFCDAGQRADVAAFFTERNARTPGGARVLAQVLESVDLCIAMKAAQGASVDAFLAQPRKPPSTPRLVEDR
jgi:alanyl aminopeptidase